MTPTAYQTYCREVCPDGCGKDDVVFLAGPRHHLPIKDGRPEYAKEFRCKAVPLGEWAEQQAAQVANLKRVLTELHALVRGECPRLLNEDSGGDASLDADIVEALGRTE